MHLLIYNFKSKTMKNNWFLIIFFLMLSPIALKTQSGTRAPTSEYLFDFRREAKIFCYNKPPKNFCSPKNLKIMAKLADKRKLADLMEKELNRMKGEVIKKIFSTKNS